MASYSRFMARFARRQQGTGSAIVVWQMCYPVQHVLDAAGCVASSATFREILLRAVSGCCYNNGGLRNRRWANAITKHGCKGEWHTSVKTLPSRGRGGLRFGAGAVLYTIVAGFP